MVDSEPKVVYERDHFNGQIHTKTLIVLNNKVKKNNIPSWVGVLLVSLAIFLSIILITACVVLLNARRPGLFNEDCVRRSCETSLGLKCINSTCQCQSDQFYLKKCHSMKKYGEFCQNIVKQCVHGLECFNGKCSCNQQYFWSGLKCEKTGSYGDNCEIKKCDESRMLTCNSKSNLCLCNDTSRFWSGYACYRKRTYNEICKNNDNCLTYQGLKCLDGLCQCNFTYKYFDNFSLHCEPKKTVHITCFEDKECLGDLKCLGSYCLCENMTTSYFNESSLLCSTKTLNNTYCTSTLTCRSDLGLSCSASRCQCDTSVNFWDGTSCIPYRLHGESCSAQYQCNSSQGTICSSGSCSCDPIFKYYDVFGLKCLLQLNETKACNLSIQCLGDMICSVGQCECSNTSTHYFDFINLSCAAKTLEGNVCDSSRTCRSDLGLSCSASRCQCDTSVNFWDGTSCIPYRLHGESCSAQYQCNSSQDTLCTSGSCICDAILKYYESSVSKCVPQKNESVSCSLSVECLGDMVCSGASCKCSNTSTHYFNQSSLLCTSKTLVNTSCVTSLTCRQDLGLVCNLDQCECISSQPYWSSVFSKCLVCPSGWTQYLTYCYFYNTIAMTWPNANNWCRANGANLLKLNSQSEYLYFKGVYSGRDYWIGLYRSGSQWFWSSDNSVFNDINGWWGASVQSLDCYGELHNSNEIIPRYCSATFDFVCFLS